MKLINSLWTSLVVILIPGLALGGDASILAPETVQVSSGNQADYGFCIRFEENESTGSVSPIFQMQKGFRGLDFLGITISMRRPNETIFGGNIFAWEHEGAMIAYFVTEPQWLVSFTFVVKYGDAKDSKQTPKLILVNESLANYLTDYNNSFQRTHECAAEI